MKIETSTTTDAALAELGARLARLRISRDLTQKDLAKRAGIGLRTLQRLETGAAAAQLSSLVKVCQALGLADRLEQLAPEESFSPIAVHEKAGKRRQRASGRRKPPTPAKWEWAE